ncbi:hypothetical protein ACRS6B_00190 [Nocardia asteroides]
MALLVLFVFPGLGGAVSTAQTGVASRAAPNSALSWMQVKDSSGIEVSQYLFVTDRGGVLSPDTAMVAFAILFVFTLFLSIGTAGVWMPNSTLSFSWLNMFAAPLHGVAETFTAQIATPIMLVTAVSVGGVFVGLFYVRGYYAKGTMQIVTMVGVAIVGPLFLAEPLAEALSSDGLLVQGRDLGLSVAAGLNGNSNPNPNQLVAAMPTGMADDFIRKPLQVWNFGHIVDDRPGCKAAWSAGVMAGDEDQVKRGLKACGDSVAYAAADNPSIGQIGAGLLLLLCALVLLLFGVYLSFKIIWAALDTIYYGFMTIFGFAAGGFIYGPTQTFTVRCVVHGFVAAGKMAAFVIFLGLYQLFMGSLFQQARGQVMAVFVIGAIVEIVAIVQLRRLSASIDSGNDWLANRFASAIQNPGSPGGSGGGTALGMGNSGANNSMSGLGLFAAASTINSSPLTAWMAGGRNFPMSPWAWLDQVEKRNKARGMATADLRAAAHGPQFDRVFAVDAARAGIQRSRVTVRRNYMREGAFAAENVAAESSVAAVPYALYMAGYTREEAAQLNTVLKDIREHTDAEPLASTHLGRVLAAHKHFERDLRVNPRMAMARFHGLEAAVDRFRGDFPGGVDLEDHLEHLGRSYIRGGPNKTFLDSLRKRSEGEEVEEGKEMHYGVDLNTLTSYDANRLSNWVTNEHALRIQAATNLVARDPSNFNSIRVLRGEIDRATDTSHAQAGRAPTGFNTLPPPDRVNRPFERPNAGHPTEGDEPIPLNLLEEVRNRYRRP